MKTQIQTIKILTKFLRDHIFKSNKNLKRNKNLVCRFINIYNQFFWQNFKYYLRYLKVT